MTISSQVRSAGPFAGNGLTTSFPFAFKVFQASDLLVVRTDSGLVDTPLTLGSDYTITLNADQNNSPGGIVVLTSALAVGFSLSITSSVQTTQNLSLPNQGGFFPRNIEDALDRLTILLQQLGFNFGQSLRTSEVGGTLPIPVTALRAGNLLGFDSLGNPIAVPGQSGTATSLALDLANTTLAPKGAGQVGVGALNYANRTIGHEVLVAPTIDMFAGVDPTGAVDSAGAIAAALTTAAALGIRTLRFPGTYKINSMVTLVSNMTYQITGTINLAVTDVGLQIPAAGTKITLDGMGSGVIQGTCSRAISSVNASSCSEIRVRGLVISGATLAGSGYQAGIFLDNVNGFWLDQTTFTGNGRGVQNVSGDNCDLLLFTSGTGNTNVFIGSQNRFISTAVSYNCMLFDVSNFSVGASEFSGALNGSSNNKGYGLAVYASSPGRVKYGTIAGPRVHDVDGSGVYLADCEDVTVIAPEVFNCARTQSDVTLPVGGVSINGGRNITVTNPMVNTSGKDGIVVNQPVTYTGVDRGITVNGGVFKGCASVGVHARGYCDFTRFDGFKTDDCGEGFFADGASVYKLHVRGTVLNSRTGGCGARALNVFDSTFDLIATGNKRQGLFIVAGSDNTIAGQYRDNGGDAANTYDGIANQGHKTKIIGVRSGNTGATGQRYGLFSNGNYCTIQNNDLTRNQTDGYLITGTNPQLEGNRLSTSATPGPMQGSAGAMTTGSVTVTTDEVRAGDLIILMPQTAIGTVGVLRVQTITPGTSFVIQSSSSADLSTPAWKIVH